EHSGQSRTDLTRMTDTPEDHARQERVEFDVVGDDRSRLTTELQGYALDLLGSSGHDRSAGDGTPREADLVDVGMTDEIVPDLASGRQYADDPFGEAGSLEGLGEHHRRHRPFGSRLEDHG